jgi:hypothetical protein
MVSCEGTKAPGGTRGHRWANPAALCRAMQTAGSQEKCVAVAGQYGAHCVSFANDKFSSGNFNTFSNDFYGIGALPRVSHQPGYGRRSRTTCFTWHGGRLGGRVAGQPCAPSVIRQARTGTVPCRRLPARLAPAPWSRLHQDRHHRGRPDAGSGRAVPRRGCGMGGRRAQGRRHRVPRGPHRARASSQPPSAALPLADQVFLRNPLPYLLAREADIMVSGAWTQGAGGLPDDCLAGLASSCREPAVPPLTPPPCCPARRLPQPRRPHSRGAPAAHQQQHR